MLATARRERYLCAAEPNHLSFVAVDEDFLQRVLAVAALHDLIVPVPVGRADRLRDVLWYRDGLDGGLCC